jgi:N-acetylmuramoyl-L-alanine amidase
MYSTFRVRERQLHKNKRRQARAGEREQDDTWTHDHGRCSHLAAEESRESRRTFDLLRERGQTLSVAARKKGLMSVTGARLLLWCLVVLTALGIAQAQADVAARVVPKPPIVWRPIPFPQQRKAEMAAYAERHYGVDTWRLIGPKVIVEHYTANESFSATWNTFANNSPDPALGELPGDCAHFVIDTNGTIYQLVSLGTMCRHTVGLNYTAIGIEHVGTSDQQILHDPRQLRASLWLTLWLMQEFHIKLANVIGHNESLTSPYHRELDPAWRCQTHQDWNRADMQIYRADLIRLARHYKLAIGQPAPPRPVPAGC